MSDACPTPFDRDQSARSQLGAVMGQGCHTGGSLFTRRKADDADHTRVYQSAHDRQLPEILVERHQCGSRGSRPSENLCVAWVSGPVTSPFYLMSRVLDVQASTAPNATVQQDLHGTRSSGRIDGLDEAGFNPLVGHEAPGINETRANILRFQPWVAGENRVGRVPGGEHPKDVLDGQSPVADDRLAGEDRRIDGNPVQYGVFGVRATRVHDQSDLPGRVAEE